MVYVTGGVIPADLDCVPLVPGVSGVVDGKVMDSLLTRGPALELVGRAKLVGTVSSVSNGAAASFSSAAQ